MQAAIDSTALMLSKDMASGNHHAAQVTAKAHAYFTALYTNTMPNRLVTATYTANNGNLGLPSRSAGPEPSRPIS